MQCSTCGMDNQAATRFCIHCGAAQTPPAEAAGASTVIAAMAQAGAPKPAPAAPPWATPPATSGTREQPAATGLRVPPADDREAHTSAGSAPSVQEPSGATGTDLRAPTTSADAALRPDEASVLLAPPPAAARTPTADRLPSFSDETAFTLPASPAAQGALGAVPGGLPGEVFAGAQARAPAGTPPAGTPPASMSGGWTSFPDTRVARAAPDAASPAEAPASAADAEPLGTATRPFADGGASISPPGSRTDGTAVMPPSSLPPPPEWRADDPGPGGPLPPAYDAAPRHRNGMLIVAGLAVLALLGIGGFFFYQVSQDRDHDGGAAAVTADATSRAPSAPASANPDVTPGAPPSAGAASPQPADLAPPATPSAPAGAPATDADRAKASSTPAPSATTPAIEPPEKRPVPRAPAPKSTRPAAPVPPPPAPTVEEPVVAPAPPPARPAPAPAPPRATDRWAQMSDDLARCRREDFINRVVCDQRVRLRYCDGYWGKVQQCPAAPQADHGQ